MSCYEDSSPLALSPIEGGHSHVLLGAGHAGNERRTWAVIGLCAAMMVLEIGGGAVFGSLALVADGLHMASHVLAILIAALAYRYARHHAEDRRFSFGTGKVGDLAGFSSAVILGLIALLVAYEAVGRLFAPVVIRFEEAIPIACLGLLVNVASAWLLSGGDHGHHGHDHHDHDHDDHDHDHDHDDAVPAATRATHSDHNFRSAFIHVAGDAAVSVLAILGLLAARYLGWVFMDPVMGLIGAGVIASWAYVLIRDTARVLVDYTPDAALEAAIRNRLEADGDRVRDLHLWRLGPGHLGAIVSVVTDRPRGCEFYRTLLLQRFDHLSHVTIEVQRAL